jgi:Zn-dependent M16 (insulinase) family peptidase
MIRREGRDSARDGVATGPSSWIDQEIAGCVFDDVRLGRRFRSLLEQICESVGESIPLACQDWANTKAAYRFLSNDRVNEEMSGLPAARAFLCSARHD